MLKPKKHFSQNFLHDKNILRKIAAAAKVKKGERVLEIGPGRGALTCELVAAGARVVAVEKDRELIPDLEKEFGGRAVIVNADILHWPLAELEKIFAGKTYRLVANIPYNITGALLRRFLEADYYPREMFVLVQKEVAERLVAGQGEMNMLALAAQYYAEPKVLFTVGRGAFFPAPKVDSAFVKFGAVQQVKHTVAPDLFFKFTAAGFRAPRKQLKNNLAAAGLVTAEGAAAALARLNFSAAARAEELAVGDWEKLIEIIEN